MADRLVTCFRQVALAQMGVLLAGSMLISLVLSLSHGLAIAYGAGLAILNTFLSVWSINRASTLAYRQPGLGMLPVFSGLVQRLITFASGFAIGVLLFGLLPLPVLAGFALAQFGYLACGMPGKR